MQKKRRLNNFSYYGKILLAVAFSLFIYGFILDITNRVKIFDPEKDAIVIKGNSDGSHVSVDSSGNDNSASSGENNSNGSTNDNTNNSTNANNNSRDNVSQEKSVPNSGGNSEDSIYVTNDNLRKTLQKKYSITILYGSETGDYVVGGLSTVQINNPAVINVALNNLDNTLKLYPKNIFKEIRDGGIPLTIYLINNYSDESVTGATDSSYSYANISIAASYPFGESFYHESYHYIERYIFKKGLTFNDANWNSFNPIDFSYGSIVDRYSYNVTFSDQSYFVNNYAQTSPEEDRASTFEYMMASSKASCLNRNNPVWKKADLMSKTIDAALYTVNESTTEYWERYL